MEVASIEGWYRNPQLVLTFYNERRKQAAEVFPNAGHLALAQLEQHFEVTIITQNVDSLHEKAGSSRILHLHGELHKAQSTGNPDLIYDIGDAPIAWGQTCEQGHQLRPFIVWFGEAVPMMDKAARITSEADIFIVVGTSLAVYPAASLVDFVPDDTPIYVIDPHLPHMQERPALYRIEAKATDGLPKLCQKLVEQYA
jgi:NAD-dependent deacetylase